MKTYTEFITTLNDNQVFVFGSNLDGFHGGGAAGIASFGSSQIRWRDLNYDKLPDGWKGKWNVKGIGRGFQEGSVGKSYALPTVTHAGYKRSLTPKEIILNIHQMYAFAEDYPEWEFLVAGFVSDNPPLNGYTHLEMTQMYAVARPPDNVIFHITYAELIQNILKGYA